MAPLPNIQCVRLDTNTLRINIGMPKRGRDGIYKSPASKKARRDAVENMMRVMDKVALGQAVMPARTNYVVRYPGPTAGLRPGSATKQGELKGVDTILTIAGPVIATTSTNADAFTLNLVSPGTASYNRVGRKIYMKNLRIRAMMKYIYALQTTSSNIEAVPVRVVVVYDQQPSGALPTFADIFGTTLQDGTEGSTIIAPVRYDNTQRFRVLSDDVVESKVEATPPLGGTGNVVGGTCLYEKFIPLRGLETVYSGQNVPCTIADLSTGGLYVFFRAVQSVDNQIDWAVSSTSFARLRYTD